MLPSTGTKGEKGDEFDTSSHHATHEISCRICHDSIETTSFNPFNNIYELVFLIIDPLVALRIISLSSSLRKAAERIGDSVNFGLSFAPKRFG